MQCMLVVIQMTVDISSHGVCPVHLPPHEGAVRDMILPIHVQCSLTLQRGGEIDPHVGAIRVGVEFPVVVADKVLHQIIVVALVGLPGKAEYVEAAAP